MPPEFLDSGFPGQADTAQASTTATAVDPEMAQMLRQQMLLTQGVMTNVKQFQMPRFANAKRFSDKRL